ncbi:MAG: hypothetical protein HOP15_13660 [Planctomycetes bacterium]|nr:hypothetical protein [Planctomycetota bacterium]
MKLPHMLLSASFSLLLALPTRAQVERAGARPQQVAVSPDGRTLLTTSAQSSWVRIVELDATGTPLLAAGLPAHPPIDVGGRSWGALFLDDDTAVVTLPEAEKLALLHRATSGWYAGAQRALLGTPRAVARHPDTVGHPRTVFVTLSGRSLMPLDSPYSWMHAVQALDLASGMTTGIFFTEREPRALAFSPDGERMYVATIAGALGQESRWPLGLLDDEDVADTAEDGGSILAYEIAPNWCYPVQRFAIGSPVRGLAVWPPPELWSPGSGYHLYATHVGEGAASESPVFGGRSIPNLVTDFRLDAQHEPQQRSDLLFNHEPAGEWSVSVPGEVVAGHGFPAVLPEALAASAHGELWVSFSASGTVGRIGMTSAGVLLGTPLAAGDPVRRSIEGFHVVHLDQRDVEPVLLDTYPGGDRIERATAAPVTPDVLTDLRLAHAPVLVHVGRASGSSSETRGGDLAFSSSPRGLAYDPVFDRLWVVTHFDEQLVGLELTGSGPPLRVELTSDWSAPSTETENRALDERRLATFGQGFDFRESGPADKVNNQACTTCHVDGHSDGKTRLTGRTFTNVPGGQRPSGSVGQTPEFAKPVAVPSLFDTGATEWLFFEGLTTTGDDGATFTGCNYCKAADFFLSTELFAPSLTSPRSPLARTGTLDSAQARGKRLFEAMNCTRCHQGALETFRRSNESAQDLRFGPLSELDSATSRRILNDRTQSFVTRLPREDITFEDDNASFRNMTDVGTRAAGDGTINGVNTPGLAGAWDNAPYLHDGRYRTLLEVLQHTFVDTDGRAAPLVLAGVPDNAFDEGILGLGDIAPIDPTGEELHGFGTHRHSTAPSGLSVAAHPGGRPGFLGSAQLADLLAFLAALSSQTELCQGQNVESHALLSAPVPTLVVQEGAAFLGGASWSTSARAACDWRLVDSATGTMVESGTTPPGSAHAATFSNPTLPGRTRLEVTARVRTVCGHVLVRARQL